MDEKEQEREWEREQWALKNFRVWSSWFSPVGLGIFVICIGVFLVLLHYAGLIG